MKIESGEELTGLVNETEAILVYFYSDKCPPCISLRPKVEQLVETEFPLMRLVYVDAEKQVEIAAKYHAFSLPVLIIYFEGKEFLRFSKYVSMSELKESVGRIYSQYYF